MAEFDEARVALNTLRTELAHRRAELTSATQLRARIERQYVQAQRTSAREGADTAALAQRLEEAIAAEAQQREAVSALSNQVARRESRYGKVGGRIHISELFHPDAVGISGCYGLGTCQSNPILRDGPHFNSLLPIDEETLDGVSGGVEVAPRVRVYKGKLEDSP